MAFVKLDVGILDSTLWMDRQCREVFITALLMAEPREYPDEVRQLKVRVIDPTGFVAPPGWYGFVPAAGPGIVNRAGLTQEEGMAALERLGDPDPGSRSSAFEGRRMIRIDGGYLMLNYVAYRDKDHTTAERSRRYRERKAKEKAANDTRDGVTITRDEAVTGRGVTHAYENANEEPRQTEVAGAPEAVTVPKVSRTPTIEEWVDRCREDHPDWPRADAESAWRHYESQGWRRGKTPIVKWGACVATCYGNWKTRIGSPGLFRVEPSQPARIPENLRPGYVREEAQG